MSIYQDMHIIAQMQITVNPEAAVFALFMYFLTLRTGSDIIKVPIYGRIKI